MYRLIVARFSFSDTSTKDKSVYFLVDCIFGPQLRKNWASTKIVRRECVAVATENGMGGGWDRGVGGTNDGWRRGYGSEGMVK